MLIDPEQFDLHLNLYRDYVRFVEQATIYSEASRPGDTKWWADRLPEDEKKAEEFRLRILSYVRDLEAEVLKLQPLAKKWTDQELDIEAGINAEFDKAQGNAGALR